MRHPVEDYVAILHREHRAPIAVAHSKRARLAGKRNNIGMAFQRRVGNPLKAIEQSPRVGSGQTGKLFEDLRRNDQGHAARSLTASAVSRMRQLIDFAA